MRWENILFKNKFFIFTFHSTHALVRLLKDRQCESKNAFSICSSSSGVISWGDKTWNFISLSFDWSNVVLTPPQNKISVIDDKIAFFDVDRPTLGSRFRGGNRSVHFIYWQEQIAAVKIELDWRLTSCRFECGMGWMNCRSFEECWRISEFLCFMRQKNFCSSVNLSSPKILPLVRVCVNEKWQRQ